MIEQYGVTYAAASEERLTGSLEEAKAKIASLKESLSRMGTINADAPEELRELTERLALLEGQKTDVIKAKDELEKLIGDVSSNMQKQFLQMFASIQEEFSRVFADLFLGGEARLVLTDPDELEKSGVEIVARPPHTKLKSISALSGGEKALCAIALIMAILRLRPTPFCILDEIDAALDEANVARFAGYLRAVSQDNQFILITHKRRTMEAADSLYGASMDETGTTKMVSLSLSDIAEGLEPFDARAQ